MSEQLSKICFGGASISGEGGGYGFGQISEIEALELLDYAFQSGITHFDTAPIYGFGLSEERLGEFFNNRRDQVYFISKCGVTWHENRRVDMSNTPDVTIKMLEESLRRLQTDYIDLYMVHWPSSSVDIRETVEVLQKAKEMGKIKHIGLCNTYLEDLKKAEEISKIEAIQNQVNIFNQGDYLMLRDYAKQNGIEFYGYATFDKGIITGRANEKRTYDKCDARSWAPWWKKSNKDKKMQIIEEIKPLLEQEGISSVELALGYGLNHFKSDYAICGARNRDQLASIVNALKNLPTAEQLDKILEVVRERLES